MSKVFDALRNAELAVAERKHSETAAAPLIKDTRAQTGSSGHGSAPNLVLQSPHTNAYSLRAGVLNHDTKIGGVVKVLAGMLAVVARPRRKAEAPRPSSIFGDLGRNLESAAKSSFWKWFCWVQTREENCVHRFQPSGTQFQSLSYLDVAVSARKDMQALTLGVQRAFIDGEHEPFARDLVRSFLCTVFLQQKSEAVSQLVNELGTEFGGARSVIAAEGARREAQFTRPSPPYLVFTGLGKRCAMESGAFKLEMQNVTEGSTQWFCLRVRLGPPLKQERSGKGTSSFSSSGLG